MRLPKRPESHIIETAAWRVLQNSIPDEWILRDVTGRDYGIDCYLELVNRDHEVTGDLISLQLKGTNSLEWRDDGEFEQSTFSGIKRRASNYWMHLPVPVFLCVADTENGKLYFASVKDQIRKRFNEFIKQDTFSFKLVRNLDLAGSVGRETFLNLYFREKHQNKFQFELIDFITNAERYGDFMLSNLNRDYFLEIEADRHLQLIKIMRGCRLLADYLGINWSVISLEKAYAEDFGTWKNKSVYLHEATLSIILKQLIPVFIQVLGKSLSVVRVEQASYWFNTDPVFFNLCINSEIERVLKQITETVSTYSR